LLNLLPRSCSDPRPPAVAPGSCFPREDSPLTYLGIIRPTVIIAFRKRQILLNFINNYIVV
jgi:hypothetical protein